MAQGLLDRLTFKTESEPDSEPDSDYSSFSESDSDLDPDFLLEPDPQPKRPNRSARRESAAPPPKVTAKARSEAKETIAALVELPIELWKRRDPHCAGVAEEQCDDMVEAFTNFVCKRPAWLAALTDLGKSGDWIKILKATYPLVMAIVAHHVTKTVQSEGGAEDDLSAFHAPRLAG